MMGMKVDSLNLIRHPANIMRTALIALFTLPHALRLFSGIQRALSTYDGLLPPAHYFPGIGDAIAGVNGLRVIHMELS